MKDLKNKENRRVVARDAEQKNFIARTRALDWIASIPKVRILLLHMQVVLNKTINLLRFVKKVHKIIILWLLKYMLQASIELRTNSFRVLAVFPEKRFKKILFFVYL